MHCASSKLLSLLKYNDKDTILVFGIVFDTFSVLSTPVFLDHLCVKRTRSNGAHDQLAAVGNLLSQASGKLYLTPSPLRPSFISTAIGFRYVRVR